MNKNICILILLMVSLLGCKIEDKPDNELSDPDYRIVFLSSRDSGGGIHVELGEQTEVYGMDIDRLNSFRLTQNDLWEFEPTYSPDGKKIVFASAVDWLLVENIYIMDSNGENLLNLGRGRHPVVSTDGLQILFQIPYPDPGVLAVMNADGTNMRLITQSTTPVYSSLGQDFPVQFTRDNKKILFKRSNQYPNTYTIHTIDIDGTNIKQLAESDGYWGACSFSPDESKIVFTSIRTGNGQIHIIDSDGSNEIPLTDTPGWNDQPVFTPDGEKIVFISSREGKREIYIMNLDGSEQTRLTNTAFNVEEAIVSPDGLKILFVLNELNTFNIFMIDIDGSNLVKLTNDSRSNYGVQFQPLEKGVR